MSKYWFNSDIKAPTSQHKIAAQEYQNTLTKPPGSLGRLEHIAIDLAAIQNTNRPSVDTVAIHIFAADHGIACESVSAFPQVVTGEMIRNFATGGAAISVLAKQIGASLQVHNLGTVNAAGVEDETLNNVVHYRLGAGSANFLTQPALTDSQFEQAMQIGKLAAESSVNSGCKLLIGGEMGIANTTSATAIACALLNQDTQSLTGPGTGLNNTGIQHKARIIDKALDFHLADQPNVLQVLTRLGGFEIAALVGFYIRAAQLSTAVLIDGYICSVAALVASKIAPQSSSYFFLSHQSAEPGHEFIYNDLQLQPLLQLNMRLGEGSGAAVAVPLFCSACALHNNMATFSQASVSQE